MKDSRHWFNVTGHQSPSIFVETVQPREVAQPGNQCMLGGSYYRLWSLGQTFITKYSDSMKYVFKSSPTKINEEARQ